MPARSLAPARAATGYADFGSVARNLQHSLFRARLQPAIRVQTGRTPEVARRNSLAFSPDDKTDGDALRSLTPDRDRPAPSPDDSASRSWRPDIPRLPFDHVRAFSDSLLLEQMNRPRRLTSRPSLSANRSENLH